MRARVLWGRRGGVRMRVAVTSVVVIGELFTLHFSKL